MNGTNRSAILRVVLLVAAGATLVVFGSQTSARSKTLQPISQEPEPKQAKDDCDIDGNSKLEDCPADTIIDQYREKYDLTVVLRGGVFWQVVSGGYVNETYGYRVILPDGVEGLCTPAPMPWHGFIIDVANELRPPAEGEENRGGFPCANRNAEVYVYVEGHYNAAFLASASDAANASLNYHKEKHPTDLIILSHERITLRRLPAVRYVVQFVDTDSGETMISEEIVAIREYDDMGIIYNIGLTTTAVRYSEDQKVLRQILKEWRTTRIE